MPSPSDGAGRSGTRRELLWGRDGDGLDGTCARRAFTGGLDEFLLFPLKKKQPGRPHPSPVQPDPGAAPEDDASREFILQAGAELGKAKREAGDYFSPLFLRLACASQKNANVHVFMKALEFISFAKKRN